MSKVTVLVHGDIEVELLAHDDDKPQRPAQYETLSAYETVADTPVMPRYLGKQITRDEVEKIVVSVIEEAGSLSSDPRGFSPQRIAAGIVARLNNEGIINV